MTSAATWRGRRGTVLLGPTEDRVARYLDSMTRRGRVTLRTMAIAEALGLERSEAYRILARLRVLGLFGIESDRGGTLGGRRIWRTARRHDGPELDAARHRLAWSRIRQWTRRRAAVVADRLASIHTPTRAYGRARPATPAAATLPRAAAGGTSSMREAMERYGGLELLRSWGVS
jgi:hypothetical protein